MRIRPFLILHFISILLLGAPQVQASSSEDKIKAAAKLRAEGKQDDASKELTSLVEDSDPRALVLQAEINLGSGKFEEARQNLEKSVIGRSTLSAYSFYLLGQTYFQLKRFKDARQTLDRVGYFQPSSDLKSRTRFLLADVAMAEKNFGEMERHLTFLERRWRRSPEYPEVLWKHLIATLHRGNSNLSCRIARRLYSSYPNHPLVYDWTIHLQNAVVDGHRLGCIASRQDQEYRLKRLQLAGETDRARKEIDQLRGNSSDNERADLLVVSLLNSDGYPEEALNILAKYYNEKKDDVDYLLPLARTAARAGEFQTAVGIYQRIHAKIPSHRIGREALFQAAFLSYQFQDYDGATRRFEKFLSQYQKSALTKDAKWNLAWLHYLREDYEGALRQLTALKNDVPVRRNHRKYRPAPRDDRILYWTGMSLAKIGRIEEAREQFTQLQKPDPTSFYALASQARLNHLPTPQIDRVVPLRELASENENQGTVLTSIEGGENQNESEPIAESDNSDDGSQPQVDMDADSTVDGEEDEKIEVSEARDPRLRSRFETADDLILIGQLDWARTELYEVERRTRNTIYLKSLVKTYENIESFHRAVSISDTFFSNERNLGGYSGSREAWETGFPKAYKSWVLRNADMFGIAPELIWSIMRAESHFKPDVMSPVGAKGLLQVMPETGRQVSRLLGDEGEFRAMSLLNPEVNIRIGSRYLARLSQRFKNSLALTAAAYNSGPHRVESWLTNFGYLEMDEFIEHIPFLETRNYVKKVTRNFAVYRGLYSGDKQAVPWLASAVPVQMTGRPALRENWDAL